MKAAKFDCLRRDGGMNMSRIPRKMKRILCMFLLVVAIFSLTCTMNADAAGNYITVTSALNGAKLYSGDDLQAAFDACERGCIVSIGRSITLTSDVTLTSEVMITGHMDIRFGEYRILLSGKGAIFVDTRFNKSKYVAAANPYSEVDWMDESGGYIYYLIAQAPDFGEEQPTFKTSAKFMAAEVDVERNIIYQDVAVDGLFAVDMTKLVSMNAENAENIEFAFSNTVVADGRNYIATGTVMTASATNFDYEGTVKKNYTLILLGDVNGNGFVDASDASLIARHVAGVSELAGNALLAADANHDGVVSAEDAELICQKYVRRDSYKSPL